MELFEALVDGACLSDAHVCLAKIRLLNWPIENRERNRSGKLHVKCAAFEHFAIIGSVNLAADAFTRSMEMGAIIKYPGIVAGM